MTVNRHRPHVLVLPEDDANRQIANGFCAHIEVKTRAIQVLPEERGWAHVRDTFHRDLVPALRKNSNTLVILVVDFDGQADRRDAVLEGLDPALRDRVFVIGSLEEPEDLKRDLGSLETVGRRLADDCASSTTATWNHPLLQHNAAELARMYAVVRPVVF